MKNSAGTQTKFSRIMNCSAFVAGYTDKRKGKPWREDLSGLRGAVKGSIPDWSYERGRQFAVIYQGPLKVNRRVAADAYRAYIQAAHDGSII